MVDIEIDGIWCKKCKTFHPTLMWHEKYDSYQLDDSKRINDIKKRFSEYDPELSRERALKIKELKIMKEQRPCIICGDNTFFVNIKTNNYVCSDECKYCDLVRKE